MLEGNHKFWTKIGKQDYYDKSHIKTKCRALKKDLKGFEYGWDSETNTITGPCIFGISLFD